MRALTFITCAALLVQGALAAPGADEAALIAALKSGQPAQVQAEACRRLARVGTREAVPALARLLADEKLSHMARLALERIPGPEASAALRAALSSLKGRLLVGTINSLAVRRDAGAVEPLGSLLRQPDPEVAAAAAVALGRIGTLSAADLLEKAMARAPVGRARLALDEGRLQCADALVAAGHRDRAIALYDALRAPSTTAAGPSPAVRGAATRGAIITRGSGGLALFTQALASADPAVVDAAFWVAQRELPGASVTEALAAAIGGLPAERQPRLILALGGRGDRAALPALHAAAASGDRGVRLAALNALSELGGPAAAATLVRMLGEPDAEISGAAREALARLSRAELANVAGSLLTSTETSSRQAAIDLIRTHRIPRFAPRLLAATRDAVPGVRLAALKSLGELAGAGELAGLLDALANAGDTPEIEAAGQAVAGACSRAGDPEACAEQVAARLASGRPAAKAALLRVLGVLGGARALQATRDALGAEDEVRAAAFDVLCEWRSPDAVPELLRLARASPGAPDRLRALRGVLRIAADGGLAADRRLSICRDAARLVQRKEEKLLLLAALGGIPSPGALDLVLPYLDDAATREGAGAAAVRIAEQLVGGADAARAVPALEKVARITGNPDLARRARELLERARS